MGGSSIDFNIGGGIQQLGREAQTGVTTLGSQIGGLGDFGIFAAAGRGLSSQSRLTPPLLQGGAAIRRIRGRGESLQPGEGQGFLGSIQAGANPDAFNQLLLNLASGGGLSGR